MYAGCLYIFCMKCKTKGKIVCKHESMLFEGLPSPRVTHSNRSRTVRERRRLLTYVLFRRRYLYRLSLVKFIKRLEDSVLFCLLKFFFFVLRLTCNQIFESKRNT